MKKTMKINQLIYAIVGIIFFGNVFLYMLVKLDGSSLILAITVALAEVLALIVISWYWMNHSSFKLAGKFRHLS